MRKKPKPIVAFAAYHAGRGRGLNPYWIRASAKDIRRAYAEVGAGRDWKVLHREGWRVVKVRVTAIGEPR